MGKHTGYHETDPFVPRLRGSEPGFSDWAAWVVPIVYNKSLAPTFEWCMSEDGKNAQFRLVDGFGTVIFGLSIIWPFHESIFDETGRLNTKQAPEHG